MLNPAFLKCPKHFTGSFGISSCLLSASRGLKPASPGPGLRKEATFCLVFFSPVKSARARLPGLGGEPKFTGHRVARRVDGGVGGEPGAERPGGRVRGRESRREDREKVRGGERFRG